VPDYPLRRVSRETAGIEPPRHREHGYTAAMWCCTKKRKE
jgi:hypothetical protein